jgi:hypothetical protein
LILLTISSIEKSRIDLVTYDRTERVNVKIGFGNCTAHKGWLHTYYKTNFDY